MEKEKRVRRDYRESDELNLFAFDIGKMAMWQDMQDSKDAIETVAWD